MSKLFDDFCLRLAEARPPKLLAACAASVLALASCASTAAQAPATAAPDRELRTIEPKALYAKLQGAAQVTVYDTNRPETYALGHVPGAILLRPKDVSAATLPADKGAMLVFYCANEH